ncbi:hypothetical protein LSH36_330g02029 [Paralvinella palmiformis]|uniref:Uncharacterized protein n=1 Tax=Paralvinella palmiformis TaxID=53620 RepID=A0AAD9JFR9_9ANNE|nr:hypothetical protein LSH36_330g02029 [Paralvinella palmiformis]
MADEQTQLKSENAELKALMTELKCSVENHHKQREKGNTTITKLQDTMSQKDKDNSDITRTITELRAQNTTLTMDIDRNKCGLVSEINHLSRVLSS